MNVYCVKPNAVAVGGCAICAARTANEAIELVNNSTDKYKKEFVDLYAMRIVHLESDNDKPCVITDCIYIEDMED